MKKGDIVDVRMEVIGIMDSGELIARACSSKKAVCFLEREDITTNITEMMDKMARDDE